MTDAPKTELGSADILEIMKLLPHRYPFLMLDRIYDMDGDTSCVGVKNVTINEPFFQGHFPGADVPLAVVQIDHTLLDIIVLDEEMRLPIGRPWLTLAIDVLTCLGKFPPV